MTKKRGIVDPWRTVEPLRQPVRVEPSSRARINLDEIDRDADMAIPNKHVIRSKHVGFDVTSTRVQTDNDALDVLANCVADLFMVQGVSTMLVDAGIGVRYNDTVLNAPSEGAPASTLKSDASVLWFIGQPLDRGMLALAKVLRTSFAAPILRRFGIVVMMTAS